MAATSSLAEELDRLELRVQSLEIVGAQCTDVHVSEWFGTSSEFVTKANRKAARKGVAIQLSKCMTRLVEIHFTLKGHEGSSTELGRVRLLLSMAARALGIEAPRLS